MAIKQQRVEPGDATVELEMKPWWWKKAVECLGVTRREIKAMHPDERDVHDVTVDEVSDLIGRINQNELTEGRDWETLEVTADELTVFWQGASDYKFLKKEQAGGDWEDVELDSNYWGFLTSITYAEMDT